MTRELPSLPEPLRLEYSVYACSSYSGQYGPENILIDDPTDQRSRWSGGSGFTTLNTVATVDGRSVLATGSWAARAAAHAASLPTSGPSRERQWLILKLSRPAVLRRITFGKYTRSHPCNVKEFKIYAGMSPDMKAMSLVYWGGLKNDPVAETFEVAFANKEGVIRPTEYIGIEPLSAHSSNYNISIWYVAVAGNDDENLVKNVKTAFDQHCENHATKLILKHLRQKGLTSAFDALLTSLPSTSALQLEHPAVSELHRHLVQLGDFNKVEELLGNIAYPQLASNPLDQASISLFDSYCETALPEVHWTRLDSQLGTTTWDGESPSARGGHQMVLVQPETLAKEDRSAFEDDSSSPSYLYLYGGWNGVTELADLWRFDLQQQRWELISNDTSNDLALGPDGSQIFGPDARSCHQMAVDQETGEIYMLGRFIDGQATRTALEVHSTAAGSAVEESRPRLGVQEPAYRGEQEGSPSGRHNAVPAVDQPVDNRKDACDFWRLHTRGPLRGTWELLSENVEIENGPTLIFDHQMQIDPVSRKLCAFGGKYYERSDSSPSFSGLYSYDLQKKTWTRIASDVDPSSINWLQEHQAIPSRTGHSMLCDSAGRRMLILAGQRSDQYLSDLWSYSLVDGKIQCLDRDYGQHGGPDGGFTQRAAMDDARSQFVLLSGLMKEKVPPHFTQVKNTIWVYSLHSGHWQKINSSMQSPTSDPASDPKPRFAHQFVYDNEQDEYYLFGGNPAVQSVSARLDDFWRLKLVRKTKYDVLFRCKFFLRRCKFYEMCDEASRQSRDDNEEDSPYMQALLYLQTELAQVTDSSSQSEFLACMGYLLASDKPPAANGSPANDEEDMQASSALPSEAEQDDIEVQPQDQERINAFSTLNHRLSDLEDRIQVQRDEKDQLEELAMELELADEDEPVLYKIASSFYHLTPEQANERVSQAIEVIDNTVENLETEASECKEKMSELKTLLYAKFGSSINLER
ncbi:hypothetical protein P389DRAFT_209091 [Cystobasidium minutum MCA 4210]|uniref:uncharacterized protein n=1 Tax=Cystobasidium minutum MCA 4210 TaxID=1397322 RepID=UPI0034CE8E23|eukprot:jgi/Rhomi1/209091/estExt_Genemark1.C_2_t20393